MHEPPTKAYCKRAGQCVIKVCSSLFIFITLDRAKVSKKMCLLIVSVYI